MSVKIAQKGVNQTCGSQDDTARVSIKIDKALIEEIGEQELQHLHKNGFVLLKNTLSEVVVSELLDSLDTLWQEEGSTAGSDHSYSEANVRRLASLVDKGQPFRTLALDPVVLQTAENLFGEDQNFLLKMMNARDPLPVSSDRQEWHVDNTPGESIPNTLTAIWYLGDSNSQNGGTIVIPGSQTWPADSLKGNRAHPDEIVIEAEAGDLLLLHGKIWHAGGANESRSRRPAILSHYVREDAPWGEDVGLFLSTQTRENLSPVEARLFLDRNAP